jgi:hypothetical protein
MARFRYYYIEDLKSLGAVSGTAIFNLPEEGHLVALIARVTGLNASSDDRFGPPHHIVQKLEVVADGGAVIKNYTPKLCKGLNHLDGIVCPGDVITQGNAMTQEESFYLLFGASLKDMEYGLNLGNHTNPQFKITWDDTQTAMENCTAIVAWNSSTHPKLTLIAVFLEEAPGPPKGYIRTQYTTYTPAASTEEVVEIPRGYPLRRLALRNFYAGSNEADVFDRVKLDINDGGYQPYNLRFQEILQLNAAMYGLAFYQARLCYTEQDSEDSKMSWYHAGHAIARGMPAIMFALVSRVGGRFRLQSYTHAGAAGTSDTPVNFSVWGVGFQHVLALPFDVPGGLASAFPTGSPVSSVKLKITSTSSAQTSSTAYVVWEDVVSY